jgi:predicted metal-binding protein
LIRLSELEREVFLAGYYKVFLLQYSSCLLCKDCSAEGTYSKCINKIKSRPGVDAMGIDIYQTAHKLVTLFRWLKVMMKVQIGLDFY